MMAALGQGRGSGGVHCACIVKCLEAEPTGLARIFMWDVREIQVSHDSKALVLNWE